MTAKDLLPKPDFLRERFWIWLTGLGFWAFGLLVVALLTQPLDHLRAMWNGPAVVDAALSEVNARLDAQALLLEELRDGLRRATGEDRIIRQPEGMSYIEEPVYQGENVTMVMVVERTALGADCRLTDWTPIFTDEGNISVPGHRSATGTPSQIDDRPDIRRIEMVPPPRLRPGRVTVYLTLIYDCDGRIVPETSDVLAYALLAGLRPTP